MFQLQNVRVAQGISPVDLGNNGAATAIAVDLGAVNLGPVQELMCIVNVGAATAANSAGTFLIEHSDDNSSWATLGTFADYTSSNDNVNHIAFIKTGGTVRRYVRVSITGGATATLIAATWLMVTGQMPSSTTERGALQTIFVGS